MRTYLLAALRFWRQAIVRGFLVLIPAGLLMFVIKILLDLIDGEFGVYATKFVDAVVPIDWLRTVLENTPGLSVLLILLLASFAGVLAATPPGKRFVQLVDKAFMAVPLVGGFYGAFRHISELLSKSNNETFTRVVLIEKMPNGWAPGFIVSETIDTLTGETWFSVMMPSKPNPVGGDVVFVPESKTVPTTMTRADVMRWSVTLGILSPSHSRLTRGEG